MQEKNVLTLNGLIYEIREKVEICDEETQVAPRALLLQLSKRESGT